MAEAPKFRRYTAEERAAMLVQAGLSCLAEGGIAAFTVDNICRRAGASRGLIAHHFGAKDGLLVAVYEAAYAPLLAMVGPEGGAPDLADLVDRMLGTGAEDPGTLRIWLALWGEIAVNPSLRAAHRRNYARYCAAVERAVAQAGVAGAQAGAVAASLIALVDGLWLERCIDPDGFDAARARMACQALLGPLLGPLAAGKGVSRPGAIPLARRPG